MTAAVRIDVEAVLGREEVDVDLSQLLTPLLNETVLITGAIGSIGSAVTHELGEHGHPNLWAFDIDGLDVTDRDAVRAAFQAVRPTVVLHLAGAKHAPLGEIDPFDAMNVNAIGTQNVVDAASEVHARVVTASTCKACDPETAYGASKLIAERITLNAGGSVMRYYNVVETAGNVFEKWEKLPAEQGIPVVGECVRRFISLREAVACLFEVASGSLEPGRYIPALALPRRMARVAQDLYPLAMLNPMAPRRGDRLEEPFIARSETAYPAGGRLVSRVTSPHDPEVAA